MVERRLEARRVPLSSLVLDETNRRTHGQRNLSAIEDSIRKHGVVEPLVVQRGTGRIVAGNGRAEVLRRLGYSEVDVVEIEIGSEDEFKALSIRLNRTGELAGWDVAGLEADLAALADSGWGSLPEFGFDAKLLDELAEIADSSDLGESSDGETGETSEVVLPDGSKPADPSNSIDRVLVELHVPPETFDEALPAIKAAIAPFADVELRIA